MNPSRSRCRRRRWRARRDAMRRPLMSAVACTFAGAVAGGDDRRTVEDDVAAQPIEHRGRRRRVAGDPQVDLRVAGDVALLRRVLQRAARGSRFCSVDVAADAEIRRLAVGRSTCRCTLPASDFTLNASCRLFCATVRLDVERRVQVVALDDRQHAAELGQRQLRRRDRHLQRRRRQVVADRRRRS